ncbi:MAG: aryl-sulfate sulfotransferase [Alphaproteobacteria bacterium]|nr:aryl-sulfate sulfotransferase [Alphaproteobacteria bacterium]MCB9697219.1 aryl-sulfate sulfotransferase [Alphaproteobacteria bacterium]
MIFLSILLACTSDKDGETDTSPTDSDTDGVGTTAETGDTTIPSDCSFDESLTVELSVAAGPDASLAALTVDTSAAAQVAVTCASTTEPDERHLIESTGAARHHELRLLGLLQDTTYTCRAVSTCPASAVSEPVSHTTGSARIEIPELQVQVDPELGMTGTYSLAPWLVDGCRHFNSPSWLMMWDPEGRPRWWWELAPDVYADLEVLYDKTTGLIEWGGGETEFGAFNSLDPWDGRVYAANLPVWDDNLFSHDGNRVDANRLLTLQYIDNHNTANTRTWAGFGIRLIDQSKGDAVLFQLDSQRYYDEGLLLEVVPDGTNGVIARDPWHANSVEWFDDPDGPVLYVSLCYGQQFWAIDGTDGSMKWRVGANLGWTVLDENGNPLSQSDLPQCQHGTERIDAKHFLFYDNGQLRGESRATEWYFDPDTKVAQRVWNWTEPGWFQPFLGDADDLGNGRVLLTQADIGCHVPRLSQIVEVDRATGRVANRMTYPNDLWGSYRTQRIDGCDLFANAKYCPAVAARLDEIFE